MIEPSSPRTDFSADWLGVLEMDEAFTLIWAGITNRATTSQTPKETRMAVMAIAMFWASFFIGVLCLSRSQGLVVGLCIASV
jgi:hypothetical protein